MNVASAGVFIAAGLMHLLADAIANDELSERSEEFWGDEGGSLTALSLCLAGFLLLVVVEQAVNVCRRRCASSATATLDGKVPLRDALDSEDIQTLEAGAGNVASSLTVAVVVALGLSLHSVMEGLALGAQEEQEAAIGIFVAILAHKGIAAFALGNKVFQSVQLGRYHYLRTSQSISKSISQKYLMISQGAVVKCCGLCWPCFCSPR
eukprot:SAG31_NODE_21_length_34109_cov_60.598824_14_plen_208_part_00